VPNWSDALDYALSNETSRNFLLKVANSTYCSENVKFKLAYAEYKQLVDSKTSSDQIRNKFIDIYNGYIDEKSLDQINLPDKISKYLKAEYTQALSTTNYVMPINVFDIALVEINELLRLNVQFSKYIYKYVWNYSKNSQFNPDNIKVGGYHLVDMQFVVYTCIVALVIIMIYTAYGLAVSKSKRSRLRGFAGVNV
jgi:hypothetical protein